MHLQAQPNMTLEWLTDPELANQGLLSRFCVVFPESNIGKRKNKKASEKSSADLQTYDARVLACLKATGSEISDSQVCPRTLKLSAAAEAAWGEYVDDNESSMAEDGPLQSIQDYANKLPQIACRFAAAMQCFDNPHADEIDSEYMNKSILLAQYYGLNALSLRDNIRPPGDLISADKVSDWLSKHHSGAVIPLQLIYRLGPTSVRTAARARKCVKILAEHGHVESLGPGIVDGENFKERLKVHV